jgi:hypothetical protein
VKCEALFSALVASRSVLEEERWRKFLEFESRWRADRLDFLSASRSC